MEVFYIANNAKDNLINEQIKALSSTLYIISVTFILVKFTDPFEIKNAPIALFLVSKQNITQYSSAFLSNLNTSKYKNCLKYLNISIYIYI